MYSRQAARTGAVITAAFAAALTATFPAAPAWAHVEVSADNPQAGAHNVTVTFDGEAESNSAGIVSERVVLPPGISPLDVRLVKAPSGWTLTPSADGYTVAGKALPAGQNAVHSIIIAQVPTDATELAFKTVETYSDGKVSRWIEIPQSGQPEPAKPAPVLKLKPAAATAPTTLAPAPSTIATTTEVPASTTTAAAADEGADGSRTGLWITVAAVLLAVAILAGLLVTRRRARQP